MQEEKILTRRDLVTRFANEVDLVLCAPYQVGDRVVRCGSCCRIIKTEYIADNRCPLCCHGPFLPAPVDIPAPAALRAPVRRTPVEYLLLLLLSAGAALFPFLYPEQTAALWEWLYLTAMATGAQWIGSAAFFAAMMLFCSRCCRKLWKYTAAGWMTALIPAAIPYIILAILQAYGY